MNADQRKQTSAVLRTAADQARELFRLAVRPGVTPEARDKLRTAHDRVLSHLERLADLLDSLGGSGDKTSSDEGGEPG